MEANKIEKNCKYYDRNKGKHSGQVPYCILIAFVERSRNAFLSQVLWDGGLCIVRFGPCIEVATVICMPANFPGLSGSLQVFHEIPWFSRVSQLERERETGLFIKSHGSKTLNCVIIYKLQIYKYNKYNGLKFY